MLESRSTRPGSSVRRGVMTHPRPAVHRTVVVVDVEGFGDQRRTDPHQLAVRDGLWHALAQAFDSAGIRWAGCRREDRGDGVLILARAGVPKGRFVLLPASDQTHGHGTHTWAALWQQYLGQLLESSQPSQA